MVSCSRPLRWCVPRHYSNDSAPAPQVATHYRRRMTRRTIGLGAVVAVAAAAASAVGFAVAGSMAPEAASSGASTQQASRSTHPNVLMIVIDDMNDWVAPLNDGRRGKPRIPVPRLQALAAQGTLFANAHTPAPLCVPARASFVTGRYPRNGHPVVGSYRDDRFDIVTITEHFRDNGYHTVGGGKLFPPVMDINRHWDEYVPFDRTIAEKRQGPALNGLTLVERDQFDWGPTDHPENELVDARIAAWAVDRLQTLDSSQPFFLGVGFHFPHLPWYLPRRWLERTPLESVRLPAVGKDDLGDLPPQGRNIAWAAPRQRNVYDYAHSDHRRVLDGGEWPRAVQAYSAANAFIDEMLGRVLDGLHRSRHDDNTIVVVFSDNGWHLGEKQHWRKATLWEESTRVPLVIRFLPRVPVGKVVHAPVSLVDIYPTLVDLAGLPPPSHILDGVALGELASGRIERSMVLTAWHEGSVALRDEHWRYIRYAPNVGELYDHRQDPMEHTNLLAEPGAWQRHAQRLSRYDAFVGRYHPL